MKKITVTLNQLFNIFNMSEVPYNELNSLEEKIYIKTPENDWVPIQGLIKKQDEKLKLSFDDGLTYFICGKKHIVLSSKGLVFAEDAEDVFNMYLGTFSMIVTKENIEFGDVYDISIEDPHLYVTPNGFVHHNTSCIKALCNQLDLEYLFINSSEQRSIDVLRQDVTSFVSTLSLDGRKKAVVFDEFCLEENEEIKLSNNRGLKLKDFELNKQYPILSLNLQTNEIEEDSGEIISEKFEEVFEIELEDGRKIIVTKEHPFFCKDINGNVIEKSLKDNLSIDDFVLTL